jgi:hypothetical protein
MRLLPIMWCWRWMMRYMMSVNGSRCGMIGWSWSVGIRCWGHSHRVMRYMVLQGINNRPATEGGDEEGNILKIIE